MICSVDLSCQIYGVRKYCIHTLPRGGVHWNQEIEFIGKDSRLWEHSVQFVHTVTQMNSLCISEMMILRQDQGWDWECDQVARRYLPVTQDASLYIFLNIPLYIPKIRILLQDSDWDQDQVARRCLPVTQDASLGRLPPIHSTSSILAPVPASCCCFY